LVAGKTCTAMIASHSELVRLLTDASQNAYQLFNLTKYAHSESHAYNNKTVKVTAGIAYLRFGPGSNYKSATSVNSGREMPLIAQTADGKWYLVVDGTVEFWISASAAEIQSQ